MPKYARRAQQETRKQQVRRVREERQQRTLYLALGGVALLIAVVLGAGYYRENYGKLDTTIVSVNTVNFTVRDYQTRLKFESANLVARYQQVLSQLRQVESDPSLSFFKNSLQQQAQELAQEIVQIKYSTLDNMIDDELVRQEAQKRNIAVTTDEVEQQIEAEFGYQRATPTPTAGPSPTATTTGTATPPPTASRAPAITSTTTRPLTPTQTPAPTTPTVAPTSGPTETPFPTSTPLTLQGFQDRKKEYLDGLQKNIGVSEAQFRQYVQASLYRRKLQEELAKQVSTTGEQIQVRHILVKTYDEAVQAANRIKSGEEFGVVAQQVSLDTGTKEIGGELSWVARGQLVPEFENAAFALALNQVSQPVTTTYGVHLIQVTAREPNRQLDPGALRAKQNQAFNDWLQNQRLASKIERLAPDPYVPPDINRLIQSLLQAPQ